MSLGEAFAERQERNHGARPTPGTSPPWGFLSAAESSSGLWRCLAVCHRRGRGARAERSVEDKGSGERAQLSSTPWASAPELYHRGKGPVMVPKSFSATLP